MVRYCRDLYAVCYNNAEISDLADLAGVANG